MASMKPGKPPVNSAVAASLRLWLPYVVILGLAALAFGGIRINGPVTVSIGK
jgi:hypothetical protein